MYGDIQAMVVVTATPVVELVLAGGDGGTLQFNIPGFNNDTDTVLSVNPVNTVSAESGILGQMRGNPGSTVIEVAALASPGGDGLTIPITSVFTFTIARSRSKNSGALS